MHRLVREDGLSNRNRTAVAPFPKAEVTGQRVFRYTLMPHALPSSSSLLNSGMLPIPFLLLAMRCEPSSPVPLRLALLSMRMGGS